jgi:hypothetical protein
MVESPYRRWLAGGEPPPSDEHRARTARVARKLAALYRALGRVEEAGALERRARALEGSPSAQTSPPGAPAR